MQANHFFLKIKRLSNNIIYNFCFLHRLNFFLKTLLFGKKLEILPKRSEKLAARVFLLQKNVTQSATRWSEGPPCL
jgi:hypothetical protein